MRVLWLLLLIMVVLAGCLNLQTPLEMKRCSNGIYSVDYEESGNTTFLSYDNQARLGREVEKSGNIALNGLVGLDCLQMFDFPWAGGKATWGKITIISVLERLPNLERVDLSLTNVSDFSPLYGLEKLRWLKVPCIADEKFFTLKLNLPKVEIYRYCSNKEN